MALTADRVAVALAVVVAVPQWMTAPSMKPRMNHAKLKAATAIPVCNTQTRQRGENAFASSRGTVIMTASWVACAAVTAAALSRMKIGTISHAPILATEDAWRYPPKVIYRCTNGDVRRRQK